MPDESQARPGLLQQGGDVAPASASPDDRGPDGESHAPDIHELSAGLAPSTGQAGRLTDRIAALERQNRELAQQLAAITGSVTWRMTRPVRGALRALRGTATPGTTRRSVASAHGIILDAETRGKAEVIPQAVWVLDTGLFDPAHYRIAAGLAADVSDLEAAAHYATIGEAQGFAPSAAFDPRLYAEANPELVGKAMGLLVHYANYGRSEGRPVRKPPPPLEPQRLPQPPAEAPPPQNIVAEAKPAKKPDILPQALWVLDTGLFDPVHYKLNAGLASDVSLVEAATHYATIGESRGFAPSTAFDPVLYADANPELVGNSMGLLVHYARYGRNEGRIGRFDTAGRIREGRKSFDPARQTLLLACHQPSRTGAPILGWNLARQLAKTHNVVIAILQEEGDLIDIFFEEAVVVLGPFKSGELAPIPMKRCIEAMFSRFSIDHAIVNSIECRPLLAGLAAKHVPTVTLVHEFASNVFPTGTMTNGLMLSTQVVFDAEVQRLAALDEWPGITRRNQHVFHQGASSVPPAPARPGVADISPERKRAAVHAAVRGTADGPVVLGLGTISMRKGVDLFVSCAQVVARALGADRVRFVWIGHIPRPHPEGHYCDWLTDQIKTAGLAKTVVFLDEVDDLSGAFSAADVMLVSSRLDPFPNVAMDAALAGVPVICFERANGFAEFLRQDSATQGLVMPYLDVAAAGTRIVELLGDPQQRRRIGAALQQRASQDFSMARYIERLQPIVDAARTITAQEQRDIDCLIGDDTFSAFLWLDPVERLSRDEAIRLHVRKAAAGQEANQYCRRPALGFVPQTYADHHPALNALPFENPLAHWIRAGKPAGPWTRKVLVPEAGVAAPKVEGLRAALHLHLFYPELSEGILKALRVNETLLDLFVSTDSEAKARDLEARLADYGRGTVTIRTCPNRGRDVGPMLTLFGEALQAYDVIGHFHGKRSLALTSVGLSTDLGVQWHAFLLQHLLGERFPMVDLILGRFAASRSLGLVFPEDPNLTGWSLDRDLAITLAARMDPAIEVPPSIDFPIGTMFWARPQALQPLFDLKLGWDDYPPEPVPIDGTMLHALERLLPVICRHAGFDFETTHIPGVSR